MKKTYLLIASLLTCSVLSAQIGYSWWQFLPSDFEDNPYPREEVLIQGIDETLIIDQASSLADVWSDVPAVFVNPIDYLANPTAEDWSSGSEEEITLPTQTPNDFTAAYTVMAGDNNLYVLYNVTDDDVQSNGLDNDFVELSFAPYGGKYDPGRPIYPDVSRTGSGHCCRWRA